MIKDCFETQKVLVVIDDVSSEECLRDLQVFHALEIGRQNNQSKVVVTGRDSAILPQKYLNSGKSVREDVVGIEKGSDLELFLQYALEAIPDEVDKEKVKIEFLGEAKKIVQLCNGLPLSLEVLGKYLGNRKDKGEDLQQWKEIWIDAFKKLQKAQSVGGDKSDKLWSSLRISYDHLGDLEKIMFLDFACIFSELTYVEKRPVEGMWDSPTGVKNLVNKSLLKVQDGRFVMHDQLRDMGRHLLLKETLKDYQHPIYLVEGYEVLEKKLMTSLMLYGIGYAYFSKPFGEFKKITTNSGVSNIASVGHEEERSLHRYSKLRLFFASKCNTPSLVDDSLSQCSEDLRWLNLTNCLGVTKIGIQKLCSFGGLRMLHISNCDNIVELPEDIDKLINLVEMEVHDCSNLQSLPDTIGKLKKLKRLVILGCYVLQVLPDSVGELCEVEHLSIWDCHQLKVIHGTQICTQKLMELTLPIVPSTCLHPCPHLRHLHIWNGQGAKEFPEDFFKTDMPKLEVVHWMAKKSDGEVEFVLKNPDGSELVLKNEGPYGILHWTIKRLEVHRQQNGSISRFSLK